MEKNQRIMELSKRLMQCRERAKISQDELAQHLHVENATYEAYEAGKQAIPLPILLKIAALLKMPSASLLGVEDREKQKVIKSEWAELTQKDCEAFDTMLAEQANGVSTSAKGALSMRFVGQKTEEGELDIGPNTFQVVQVQDDGWLKPDVMLLIPMFDDSMDPEYEENQILIVNPSIPAAPGQVGFFGVGNKGYIRMLAKKELIPLNPIYDPIALPKENELKNLGSIVGSLEPGQME